MKKLCTLLVLLMSMQAGYSQFQERNWIMGVTNSSTGSDNITMDFFPGLVPYSTPTPPAMSPTTSQITSSNGSEGWAVFTDPNTGVLQFYTDGKDVFNGSHVKVNGPGTDLGASPSSAQPVVACVQPICPFEDYYIFSNPAGVFPSLNGFGPLTYRIYNTNTQTFTPALSSPASAMPGPHATDEVGEGMILIPNAQDPFEYWLINRLLVPGTSHSTYVVYRIDEFGIFHHADFDFGPAIPGTSGSTGPIMNMAYSVDAVANPFICKVGFACSKKGSTFDNHLFSIDFNMTTGNFDLSTYNLHTSFSSNILYDLEFSPNGQFIYYGTYFSNILYQFDLSTNSSVQMRNFGVLRGGGLKRGPDNKIYHTHDAGTINGSGVPNGTARVGRLETPDVLYTTSIPFNTVYTENVFTKTGVYAYNFPEFVTVPLWSADISLNGGGAICPGEEVILSSTINTLGVSISGYEWYYNGSPITGAAGANYTANQPGTYQLKVLLSGDCFIWSNIIVITEKTDCCYAIDIDNSTIITANQTVDQNKAWEGKVYLEANVTVTVNSGATLDITNVDVLFGECAGIVVEEEGKLVANNSVFRPCTFGGTWEGIYFSETGGASEGYLNENTFIGAVRAIFSDQSAQRLQITNNLFINNKNGIQLASGDLLGSISGNTFRADNDLPDFSATSCDWGAANIAYGVHANAVNFTQPIAQNDFVYAGLGSLDFRGISMTTCRSAEISDNNFTNLANSISSGFGNDSRIENNEFTLENYYTGYQHQIILLSPTKTLVKGNNLYNGAEGFSADASLNHSAIYAENAISLDVKANTIKGFETGVQLHMPDQVNVLENTIEDARYYGIYAEDNNALYISCNTINMDAQSNNDATGIGLYDFGRLAPTAFVRSNCILETDQAIYLNGSAGVVTMPEIHNNYMYNYTRTGVESINYTGNIGNSITPGSSAGHNTFVSNNGANGAVNIITNVAINAMGNFMTPVTSGPVTVSGTTVNSTASCGRQISQSVSENAAMVICDPNGNPDKMRTSNGSLTSDFERHLPELNYSEAVSMLHHLAASPVASDLDAFYTAATQRMELKGNESLWLAFWYNFHKENWVEARKQLDDMSTSEVEEAHLISIYNSVISQSANGKLNSQEISDLEVVADQSELHGHLADALLMANQVTDYQPLFLKKAPEHLPVDAKHWDVDENISLYPNPANSTVMVRSNLNRTGEAKVLVTDVRGSILIEQGMTPAQTEIEVDLNTLAPGVYLVSIAQENGDSFHTKLVKK